MKNHAVSILAVSHIHFHPDFVCQKGVTWQKKVSELGGDSVPKLSSHTLRTREKSP